MVHVKVIKRTKEEVEFDCDRIKNAICKSMKYGSGIDRPDIAEEIAKEIQEESKERDKISISEIEDMIYLKLIEKGEPLTAKAYTEFKAVKDFQRKTNTIDSEILGIINGSNEDAIDENSNKNAHTNATQRDLIAGEWSKDYCRRKKLPGSIVQAHDDGIIHYHDLDYFAQRMNNCCLDDIEGCLENTTVINGKLIETPKSFRTACTIMTQLVQQTANGQYGGQSVSLAHLAKYVRVSYEKQYNRLIHKFGKDLYKRYSDWALKFKNKEDRDTFRDFLNYQLKDIAKEEAEELVRLEIKDGIQTIQYQVNTFSTSNGQAPFLTIFMWINEKPEYRKEMAMLIEEMLNQRYQGIKNEVGVYITPSFPKLIYVLDDNNVPKDSEYRYLTDLAVKTVAKRMMPDFISAKIMRQNYDGEVFPPMGCRSFLSPWKDPETGKYKWYGRFNQGVVTINLVDVALSADRDESKFWDIFDTRLQMCKEGLLLRHKSLEGTLSDVSPIHWQHGILTRLGKHEKIDKYLHNGYSTISLGYTGLYETVLALIGKSHTTPEGEKLALRIMQHMKDKCEEWKAETGIGFGLYGTPSESTTYKFAKALRKRFGVIEGITDKDYIVNSYHVDIKEQVSATDKLKFEAKFQKISSGGAVSYVEVPNMNNNLEALDELITFMYDNIQYAEINTKSDYCQVCGYSGEILCDDNYEWYCPNCGNRDRAKLNVCRRTCGYLGDNFWNKGRTADIKNRVLHLDNVVVELDDCEDEDTKEDSNKFCGCDMEDSNAV